MDEKKANLNEYSVIWLTKNYLSVHGLKGLLITPDFLLAFLMSFSLSILAYYHPLKIEIFIKNISSDLIVLNITLLTIIIAGLAIVVSFTDEEYIMFLKISGIYNTMLFSFFWVAGTAGLAIVFAIFLLLISSFIQESYFILLIGLILFFLSFYVLFGSIQLVRTIVREGILRGKYIELKYKKKQEKL